MGSCRMTTTNPGAALGLDLPAGLDPDRDPLAQLRVPVDLLHSDRARDLPEGTRAARPLGTGGRAAGHGGGADLARRQPRLEAACLMRPGIEIAAHGVVKRFGRVE